MARAWEGATTDSICSLVKLQIGESLASPETGLQCIFNGIAEGDTGGVVLSFLPLFFFAPSLFFIKGFTSLMRVHAGKEFSMSDAISSNAAISSSPHFLQSSTSKVWYVVLPLLLLMLATRSSHFATAWNFPDASRAVFFLGGFYLARKYFGVFLATAIAMDFISMALGGSRACLSPGYILLVPAFAVLWFGGEMLRKIAHRDFKFFAKAAAYWWVCASIAYLMTNAGYYFLSGKFDPTFGGWLTRVQTWYAMFVAQPMLYLIAAAAIHFIVKQLSRSRSALR